MREAVTVQYAPPKFDNQPLIPAEVGTLIDERLDPRDMTASIVSLAVKGYLRSRRRSRRGSLPQTDYYLKRKKEADSTLGPFEMEIDEGPLPGKFAGDPCLSTQKQFLYQFTHFEKDPLLVS